MIAWSMKSHSPTREEDFLVLPERLSAKTIFTKRTNYVILATAIVAVSALTLLGTIFNIPFPIVLSATAGAFYLTLYVFKLWVVKQSFKDEKRLIQYSENDIVAMDESALKTYTVLIPLYKEAPVVPQILRAMGAIDYPTEKIEFLVTLEAYDHETREAFERVELPRNWRIITLPDVQPKTKPKALNVALREAKGEYLVIYDAEVVPEPLQLKRAALAFKEYPGVAALQCRLDHYNANQNILSRLFNAEFVFYYDLFLPGLEVLNLPIPLSGHSTHFRRNALLAIGSWDPYNVTEDVDVAIRLYRAGYRARVLDSVSEEEATVTLGSWLRQRTRWIKGFLGTAIVHYRYPLTLAENIGGWRSFVLFCILLPLSNFIHVLNLLYFALTTVWLLFRPEFVQLFFNLPVLYISYTVSVLGIATSSYLNLIALYRRKRFSLVKYALLSPAYWVLLAYAGVRAMYQLFRAPTVWEKTTHGTHLLK